MAELEHIKPILERVLHELEEKLENENAKKEN
jgi:hypothetical protein